MSVDKNEAPIGYEARQSVNGCSGCAFKGNGERFCLNGMFNCCVGKRADGCSVIFVKKENAVDPNEAPEGFIAVARISGCFGCIYRTSPGCFKAECQSNRRKDGKDVIFVRREEAAKTSNPTVELSEDIQRDLWAAIVNGVPLAKGNTNDEVARHRVALKIWDGVRGALKIR